MRTTAPVLDHLINVKMNAQKKKKIHSQGVIEKCKIERFFGSGELFKRINDEKKEEHHSQNKRSFEVGKQFYEMRYSL